MNKPPTKKYLDLMARAKTARHYIAEHPGLTFREISKALFPMHVPIMWLYTRGYVTRKGGLTEIDGCVVSIPTTYYVQPIGESNAQCEDREVAAAAQEV